jgi:hypothetical protein
VTAIEPARGVRWHIRRLAVPLALSVALAASSANAAPSTSAGRPVTLDVAAAPLSAPDVALDLESLFGHHSVLAADMMRARLRADPDFAQAANAALTRNTGAIATRIEQLAGEKAEYDFGYLWKTHIQALFNYARGLADRDNGVRDDARKTLLDYENRLAGLFITASHGRLPVGAARAAVAEHVGHLLGQADAYSRKDYATSGRLYRESYEHTYALGGTIASVLVPQDQAAQLTTPAWKLRSELGRLLGEHVALLVATMRSGLTGGTDFSAAAANINANTLDLTRAVDGIFGAPAAKSFQGLWSDHIDQLIRYTNALVKGDTAARDAARAVLDKFQDRLAAFLSGATGKRLGASALTKALVMHDQMLIDQITAFQKRDYQRSHDIAYTTYTDMVGLASGLAAAFGATTMAGAPRGGIQTGYGGMAGHPEHH